MIQFTTADAVATHLRVATADALAADVAAAVNAYLDGRTDLLVPDEIDPEVLVPSAAAKYGATMLGARLHRRRNSPNGLEGLDGESVTYVARTDSDIARLLRIDAHTPPGVA